MMGMHKPGVMGTVTAVSGNTITITAKQFAPRQWNAAKGTAAPSTATPPTATTVTYTIDATNATVKKAGVASSVSNIAVGDMIMAQGTVSGTSVTATTIDDGFAKGMGGGMMGQKGGASLATLPAGNGQPIVGGAVTAVSGTTITITNTAGVTYTIDASSAKFTKGATTGATIANISVGDNVIVQGTVSGNAVTAASVIDQGAMPMAAAGTSSTGTTNSAPSRGFFGSIGSFFSHLFGF